MGIRNFFYGIIFISISNSPRLCLSFCSAWWDGHCYLVLYLIQKAYEKLAFFSLFSLALYHLEQQYIRKEQEQLLGLKQLAYYYRVWVVIINKAYTQICLQMLWAQVDLMTIVNVLNGWMSLGKVLLWIMYDEEWICGCLLRSLSHSFCRDCLQSNFSAVTQCRWLIYTYQSCVSTSVTSTRLCLLNNSTIPFASTSVISVCILYTPSSQSSAQKLERKSLYPTSRSGWGPRSRSSSRHPPPKRNKRRSA